MSTSEQLIDTDSQISPSNLASDAHNASTAPFATVNDCDITLDKRHFKQIPKFTSIEIARFWSQVKIGAADECWPWTGYKVPVNSGKTFYGQYRGFKVHRIAYTLLVGPIPEGFTIDHVRANGCTNTLCCNAKRHLEPVTMAEQVVRRDADRLVAPGVSRCKWGHERPIGRKAHCRECAKRFAAEYRARKDQARIDKLAFSTNDEREPGLHSGEYGA